MVVVLKKNQLPHFSKLFLAETHSTAGRNIAELAILSRAVAEVMNYMYSAFSLELYPRIAALS